MNVCLLKYLALLSVWKCTMYHMMHNKNGVSVRDTLYWSWHNVEMFGWIFQKC